MRDSAPPPATVITGAAAGLGAVIAAELTRRGQRLILVDRDREALAAAAAAAALPGGAAPPHVIVADLSSLAGAQAAAEDALRQAPLDGLVNNAGGQAPGEQYPAAAPDAWHASVTLNLLTPMLLTQLLWEELARASGAVVNIGSSGGLGDAPYASPEYGAAKAGLHRFTTSLGDRRDVRVTGVIPGWIGLARARAERAAMSPAEREATGPLVEPEAIAREVADLLERGHAGELRRML
ncbi:SDR family oxidoreductase [Leifsonia sp. F6_8S_P_1B]|uniref:SDR family oxidoreductase n=1 Tax=Leifsonia williamsii TaxID=3035919 RepID=A0ABT8KAB6_9MICO|nr:SDR family oxidoreductase [Leifsonia williamsii]MDN4614112.1 SDR family oxidoreductase [Leifsonia williamsii]